MNSNTEYIRNKFPKFTYYGRKQSISDKGIAEIAKKVLSAKRVFCNRSPRFIEFNEAGIDAHNCHLFDSMTYRELPMYQWFEVADGVEVYINPRQFGDQSAQICVRAVYRPGRTK